METVNTSTISAIEVKKELYKTKVNAKFSHFENNNMYYTLELAEGKFIFPIATAVKKTIKVIEDDEVIASFEIEKATADTKGATFGPEVKGSELNRWIEKAIKNDDFVKIN